MRNNIMEIDGERKSGLDFVADLWSGRLHGTVAKLHARTEGLSSLIHQLTQEIIVMTQNERLILEATSVINTEVDHLTTQLEALRDKVANMPEAEDLSEEMQGLNASLDRLKGLAGDMVPTSSEGGDVSVSTPTGQGQETDPEAPGATVQPTAGTGENEAPESGIPEDPAPPTPVPSDEPTPVADANPPVEDNGETPAAGSTPVVGDVAQPETSLPVAEETDAGTPATEGTIPETW